MIFHESAEFIKQLDKYLFDASTTSANYLFSNKSRIPQILKSYNKPLYRGIFLNNDDYELLISNKFDLKKTTSWTKEEKIATRFLNDPKLKFQNQKNKKIILIKTIHPSNIIIDIDKFISFYGENKLMELGIDELNIDSGMAEKEVLVGPVKISSKEFKSIS